MPPVDLDWGSEDDWGSGLDWDAVDREASKRLKLSQGHARAPQVIYNRLILCIKKVLYCEFDIYYQMPPLCIGWPDSAGVQVGTGARQSARPFDAPNQQPVINVNAVQEQQNHQQQQPMPISSLSVRQLFIKRHMPAGHQQHHTSTAGQGTWGQQWRQQREPDHGNAGPSEATCAPGSSCTHSSVSRPLPNSCHGESQSLHGISVPSDAQGRTPLTDKQQRLPAAHAPLQKPHQTHMGQHRSPAAMDVPRPGVPTVQHPGQPDSSRGQCFGQQASEAPQTAGSASVRLPQRFPAPFAPSAGRNPGACSGYQQGSGSGHIPNAGSAVKLPERTGPQQSANCWPQHVGTIQQQQQQQQQHSSHRNDRTEGDACGSRQQAPKQQQSMSTIGSTAVDASAHRQQAFSGGLTTTKGSEPHSFMHPAGTLNNVLDGHIAPSCC